MKGLGEVLVEMGVIDEAMLELAVKEAESIGRSIEEVLVLGFFVPEDAVAKASAAVFDCRLVDLSQVSFSEDLVNSFTPQDVEKFIYLGAVPFEVSEKSVKFAAAKLGLEVRMQLEKYVRRRFGKELELFVAPRSQVEKALNDYFLRTGFSSAIERYVSEALEYEKQAAGVNAAVPLLLDALLTEAVYSRATDLHLVADSFSVRHFLRIDGLIRYIRSFPVKIWPRISSAVKQRSGMDPGDRIHVQDGHFTFIPGTGLRRVNVRVSAIPTADEGESIVMRILDESRVSFRLPALGFFSEDLAFVYQILEKPHGLILVTGPTGSGKTTTLYSILQHLRPHSRSVLTIEDPVEYNLPFVRQVQVNRRAGRIPAQILRSFLRHDPDVILVGEIRDRETAEVAMQAAETGHLVLSTLHTNDAPSAVIRLKDMGIDPISIASTLRLVIAQRLVRVLCPHCKKQEPPESWERAYLKEASFDLELVYHERGCELCSGQGFIGRTVVYELIGFSEADYEVLRRAKSVQDVVDAAKEKGYKPLRFCGLKKVSEGVTTVGEVMRVCG